MALVYFLQQILHEGRSADASWEGMSMNQKGALRQDSWYVHRGLIKIIGRGGRLEDIVGGLVSFQCPSNPFAEAWQKDQVT